MAWVQQRGKAYYACWREPGGKPVKKSCGKGEDGKALAKKLCEQVKAQMVLGTYEERQRPVNWPDFLKEYKERVIEPQSLEQAEIHLRAVTRFGEVCQIKLITKVTVKDVETFISVRKQDKGKDSALVSPATVNKDLGYIKTLLTKAYEWGHLRQIPKVPFLKVPERIKSYIDQDEFKAIHKACPDSWWRGFLLFQFMTGWRVKQVLRLRWYNLDLVRGEILSDRYDTKGRRDVLLPLHELLLAALMELKDDPKRLNTNFVFAYTGDRARLYDQFQAIQEKAQIKPRNTKKGRWYAFHDLRRGFATLNAERLDILELKELMMHKDIKTTLKYVDMARRLKPAVDKIHVPDLD